MPGPYDSLLLILAAIAACAAITLLLLGLRKRPTRKTPHCPRCQYNLAGLIYEQTGQPNPPCPTCPECGYTATSPRQLLRLRRRRGIIALALLSFAVALACYQWPEVRTQGRWGFVPLSIRVALCRAAGTQAMPSLTNSIVAALEHGPRLRDWHVRWLVQAHPPAIIVPDAWLPGIPLHLGIDETNFRFSPANIDSMGTHIEPMSDMDSGVFRIFSYLTEYRERTFPVLRTSSRPGHLQTESLSIYTAGYEWIEVPMQFSIALRDSIDEIKVPIDTKTANDALQRIAPRLVQQPPTGSWGITTSTAGASKTLPQTTVLALRLTILRDGKPIAEARWRQRPGESLSTMGTPARLREPGSTVWVFRNISRAPTTPLDLNLDPNDTTLTVRITTDEELALCDFSATHYWRGDVTLPISALFAPTP